MHRSKLLSLTVGIVIAAAGVSAGPAAASPAKPKPKPTTDVLVKTVKTANTNYEATLAFVRG
jgi:hypothetical protein